MLCKCSPLHSIVFPVISANRKGFSYFFTFFVDLKCLFTSCETRDRTMNSCTKQQSSSNPGFCEMRRVCRETVSHGAGVMGSFVYSDLQPPRTELSVLSAWYLSVFRCYYYILCLVPEFAHYPVLHISSHMFTDISNWKIYTGEQ